MEFGKKPWYLSKTIWIAVIAAAVAILNGVNVEIPSMVYEILIALGLLTGRTGNKSIK